ncbi:MAG: hypothetical protein NPINA01_27460 [Nitrospinaceae bacterium]|nr:MAG: hypothetical protein NPINA01_27460 [Nitrospinaceae bacterium]
MKIESQCMNRLPAITQALVSVIGYFLIASQVAAAPNAVHPGKFSFSAKQKAEFLISRKQYAEAIEAYKSLLGENGEDSALFRGLVQAYQGGNRLEEAGGFIREYLSSHMGSSAGHYGLGYYYYLKGDDPEAQKSFEKATGLNAENALAWNNWGASLSRTKSYTFAVEKVNRAIRLDPSNPMFYNNLWVIRGAMGESGLFFANYKHYVRDGPKLVAQGYGRVIAKTLRQEAFRSFSEGNLKKSIEKFSETAEIYKEIDHSPGLVATYFGLGVLYEENGDAAMAQEYFKKVLSINPNHLQAREKVK